MKQQLIDLVVRSKGVLQEGEEICFQGTELIESTKELFQNLQILYPRLVFIQNFLDFQLEGIESLIDLSKSQLTKIEFFINDKINLKDKLLEDLNNVLENLKELDINKITNNSSGSKLIDYIDLTGLECCKNSLLKSIEELEGMLTELENKVNKLEEVKTQIVLNQNNNDASISLEESGLTFAKTKSTIQSKQANTMAQALLTLAHHYDKVTSALRNWEEDSDKIEASQLYVLERDTEELDSLTLELKQSLQLIESIKEDAIVRQQLYHVVYQEKITELIRATQAEINFQETEQSGVETYSQELDSLIESYHEFIEAYHQVNREFERRKQAEEENLKLVQRYQRTLDSKFQNEVQFRDRFLAEVAPFLPGDLTLALKNEPIGYHIIQIEPKREEVSPVNESDNSLPEGATSTPLERSNIQTKEDKLFTPPPPIWD